MSGAFASLPAAGWAGWPAAAPLEMASRAYRAGDRYLSAERCRGIIASNGWHFDALHLLGVIHLDHGEFAEAVTCLDRATRLKPNSAAVFFRLGNALAGLRRYNEAITALRRTVALDPASVDARNNMGNAMAALHQYEAAIACYQEALAVQPGHPPTLFNRGQRLAELGRLEEAEQSLRSALVHAGPKTDVARLTDIHDALGRVLLQLGRHEEALATTRTMLTLNSDPGRAEWCASLVLLALGRFAEGWEKYEFRYAIAGQTRPHERARVLDLAAVDGKHILICGEQGYGDTIMFARYAGLLARAGAKVSVAVYPELKSLLGEMEGVSTVITAGDAEPACDFVTAFPSLPLAFRTELDSIPADVPYLRAPAKHLAAWQERLGPWRRPRIGICCRGSQSSAQRSMPVGTLARVLDRADIDLHIIQKEIAPADRASLAAHPAMHVHSEELADFADTAALLSLMDLVITIDTAVAHLAGALARPVWIMIPSSADWRWLLDRDDSPWYPTARLFRQEPPGDWDMVCATVARALDEDFLAPHGRLANKPVTSNSSQPE